LSDIKGVGRPKCIVVSEAVGPMRPYGRGKGTI